MNVWVVRAEYGKFADNFRKGRYMGIYYGIDEHLPIGDGKEAFIEVFKKYHPASGNLVVGQQVGQLTRFCEDIKPGDYVITPSENIEELYYGKVLDTPYRYDEKPADHCPYRHRRDVQWSKQTVSRSTFSVPLQNTLRSSLTVFQVSQAAEFLTAIAAEGYEPPAEAPAYNPYENVLEQILRLDAQEFEVLVGHLLTAVGFEKTKVTGKTGDGGVDVTGTLSLFGLAEVEIYVQAKRYRPDSKIAASVVRQLRMAIPSGGQGAFITTADYRRKAYEVATEDGFPRIGLINGRQLVDLLVEHWQDIPEEFQNKLGLRVGLVLSS